MPPPQGRPYNYSLKNVHGNVPSSPGVYWLRSENGVTYIGESTDLCRRLKQHAHREPVRFQYNTTKEYCRRYQVSTYPFMSPKELCYKIENTEFRAYRDRFGTLPPENKQDNHYQSGVLEDALDYIHSTGNRWF